MARLSGRTAVITGAGSGIGRASALLFAQEGASLVIADKADTVNETADMVRAAGGKLFLAHACDPNGTSLKAFSSELDAQLGIIENHLLGLIDGLECWHSRLNATETRALLEKGLQGLVKNGTYKQLIEKWNFPDSVALF